MTGLRRSLTAAGILAVRYRHRLSTAVRRRKAHRKLRIVATTDELTADARLIAGERARVTRADPSDCLALAGADLILLADSDDEDEMTAVLSRFVPIVRGSRDPTRHGETVARVRDALIAADRDGEFVYQERSELVLAKRMAA